MQQIYVYIPIITSLSKNWTDMELKRIALHQTHVNLGAKIVPFAGFEMPVRYSSDKEEHLCVRESVGVFDVSHMGEFFIEGAASLDLIQKITSNDAAKLVDGQAQYTYFPNENGGIVDDLLVYRFSSEKYMFVVNASNIEKDWHWISKYNADGVVVTNLSDSYSLFAVQGPNATAVLQKITTLQLNNIRFYHFAKGEVGGVKEVIVSATGYTGAGGFELYVQNEEAKKLWNAILDAGAEYEIRPIGLGARDTLRMEMGFCLYGNDIDDITSPIEAGLGWVTKFTKEFINADNLLMQKKEGVSKKLVGFLMQDKGIPRSGYDITDETGASIGRVTSGTMSPSLNMGIGLGYVKKELSQPGMEIYISVRNKSLRAVINKLPLLKN